MTTNVSLPESLEPLPFSGWTVALLMLVLALAQVGAVALVHRLGGGRSRDVFLDFALFCVPPTVAFWMVVTCGMVAFGGSALLVRIVAFTIDTDFLTAARLLLPAYLVAMVAFFWFLPALVRGISAVLRRRLQRLLA